MIAIKMFFRKVLIGFVSLIAVMFIFSNSTVFESIATAQAATPQAVTQQVLTKPIWELTKEEQAEQAKTAANLEKLRKAKAKKVGIEIGYTAKQVVESSWGKPTQVNTTTNKYGTREQWVYRGQGKNGYVYLENGIVTSVQN
jgi:hypothetical protein